MHLQGWPGPPLKVRGLPQELRNMELNTGLLMWDAGRALAQLVLLCPSMVEGELHDDVCLIIMCLVMIGTQRR